MISRTHGEPSVLLLRHLLSLCPIIVYFKWILENRYTSVSTLCLLPIFIVYNDARHLNFKSEST